MTFLNILLVGGATLFALMLILWGVSLSLRNSGIVDVFWGAGFVISCWLYFSLTPAGLLARKWLLASMVSIWGIRLSCHIFFRNRGKGEDFRYRSWREESGESWWWRSLFTVFILQGALMWCISTPLLAAQTFGGEEPLGWLDFASVAAWLAGFFFEAAGDWQLARFRRDEGNRGKVLNTGVWRYTRHPNYFGDALQWWAFWMLAAAAGGPWTIFSPALMTLLLRRVSGVTLLERSLVVSKPGYREYVESTNAFFPWFPRSS